ncbi:MAG TPA: S41 family peptidase, partial [Phnomibacter sp.]|nr:S41 family peptidase [Phnomibacter sp.]
LLASFSLQWPSTVNAQPSGACDCLCDFEYLKKYVETNHPGFTDQVTDDRRPAYEKHADSIRTLIRKGEQPCLPLLRAFTSFIRDRHMSLGISSKVEDNDSIVARIRRQEGFDKHERIQLDEATINRLKAMPYEAIEGIYQNANAGYVVAMMADPKPDRDFVGVIVSSNTPLWQPGQVKWAMKKDGNDLAVRFWLRYFDTQDQRWDGRPGSPIFGSFYKEGYWKQSATTNPSTTHKQDEPMPFTYRFLSDTVGYMQIPSFAGNLYSRFEKAYREVLPQMENYPYWIIDIRGNGGGADQCLQALVPYLYTDTLWSDVVDIYVTPENVQRHTEALERMEGDKNSYSPNTVTWWAAENKRMQSAKPFTYLQRGANQRMPHVLREVKPMPRKVVMMYDRGAASSAETLIFVGKESGKTITFGENSFGATGYGEVSNHTLPGGMYQLNIPLTRYRYQGKYDTVGIPPQVRAQEGKDWIEQAIELLR